MPIRYRVIDDGRLVVTQFHGAVSDDELREHGASMAADDDVRWPVRQLVDARRVTNDATITPAGLRDTAELKFGELGRVGKVAVLVGSDLVFGLSRLFEAYAEALGGDTLVARTLPEACAFLDADHLIEAVGAPWGESA